MSLLKLSSKIWPKTHVNRFSNKYNLQNLYVFQKIKFQSSEEYWNAEIGIHDSSFHISEYANTGLKAKVQR
jgi:hypothetical protein